MSLSKITVNNQDVIQIYDEVISDSDELVNSSGIENRIDTKVYNTVKADFVLSDSSFNPLCILSDGHIKTKNFDSSNIDILIDTVNYVDTGIVDASGNFSLAVKNGEIITKNFNSKEIGFGYNNICDFGFNDSNNNYIMIVKDGYPITKNFDSRNVLQDIEDLKHSEPEENIWKGKGICILGDSITDQGYYITTLQEELGCIVYNRGVSGTYIADNTNHTNDMVNRIDLAENNNTGAKGSGMPSASNVDLFMLYGGTNDWWHGAAGLGSFEAAIDITTFYGALKRIVMFAKNKYPRKPIVLCTMLGSCASTSGGFTDYIVNADGSMTKETKTKADGTWSKQDYNDAIRKIAAAYGCYLIDLDKGIGLSSYTKAQADLYYTNGDGVHPSNGYGATLLGKYFAKYIKNNISLI